MSSGATRPEVSRSSSHRREARHYRLPHNLTSIVEVSDRFHLKPLLRALTFPHTAFVLALSQGSVRLLEIAPELDPAEVAVPDLPSDVATRSARQHDSGDVRAPQRRASADIADIARAATYGLVDTVLVDIDESIPGYIDENGAVTFDDADDAVNYGVGDEIARRVWLNGGKVLAIRRDDIPGNGSVAAILRYSR